MLKFSLDFLSAAGGGNQFCPHPFRFPHARYFNRRVNLFVFVWRNSRGNELAALLFGRKRRAAYWIRFTHGFFFGGGVLSKAVKVSLNVTPLKFGIIISSDFFRCFCRFDFATISLSAPHNMRGFGLHQAINLLKIVIPSNHLPIG